MSEANMVPGKSLVFADGVARVLPPLTFRQVREADESGLTLKLLNPTSDPQEAALAGFALIHAALSNNYSELKLEDMEALLDPGLVEAAIPVLFGKLRVEDRVVEGKAASG